MRHEELIAASYEACRRVARKRARNFYYGMKLTPQPRRGALYAVYAFMRACDDLADEAARGGGAQAGLKRIEEFRALTHAVLRGEQLPPGEAFWPAFRDVLCTYPIDIRLLDAMLDGQRDDLTKHRYASVAELEEYCYKVAGVVGLVCVSVWGCTQPQRAGELAVRRGLALQLTNITRDLLEDARRDRLYLPLEVLRGAHLDEATFLEMTLLNRPDARWDQAVAWAIEHAQRAYRDCEPLDDLIDPACRGTSWALMSIYRRLLEKIALNPRSVLGKRVRLSSYRKAWIALRGARLSR